ncbi:sortase [Candidatus Dojkabacteria bacterium]|nr:sortase [Candidatus Dojkabacteria bacterium]
MLRFLSKLASFILLLSVIAGATFFIVYPHYPEIKATVDSLNSKRLANNITLQLMTYISPADQAAIIKDLEAPQALEHISTDELIRLKNEGKILFNMEKANTSLYIPSASINGKVVDDESVYGMERGFWHFPLSSQPGKRGNTVIIAHRFLHLPPRTDTFFNLDKVKVGDKVIIEQKDATYRYTVVSTKVVEKTDRSILENYNDYRITLVTCTPLWTSNQRLVVIGKLDKIYGSI